MNVRLQHQGESGKRRIELDWYKKASPQEAGSSPPSPHRGQHRFDLLSVTEAHGQEVAVRAVLSGAFEEDPVLDLLSHKTELLQILPQLLSRPLGQVPVNPWLLCLHKDNECRLVRRGFSELIGGELVRQSNFMVFIR